MPIQMVLPTRDSFSTTTIQLPSQVSDDELMRISRGNPGVHVERIGWNQIVMSPSGTESGGQTARILTQVARWSDDHESGEYFGPDTGFRLPDGSVLSPDVAWVSTERVAAVPGPDREGYWPICPDLVIEVASESDSRNYLHSKCERWISYGASVAILIDPRNRTTYVFTPEAQQTSTESEVPVPGFPGLTLKLERVWQGLRGRTRQE